MSKLISWYNELWFKYYKKEYFSGHITAWDCWAKSCLNIFCPSSVSRKLFKWLQSISDTINIEDKYKCE